MGLLSVFLSSKTSLGCTCFCFLELCWEEQSGPAARADEEPQAEDCPRAPSPSLPQIRQEDGGEAALLEAQKAEV